MITKTFLQWLIFGLLLASLSQPSCKEKEETPKDPNALGGEVDIELTKEGNVTDTYLKIGNSSDIKGSMTVVKNDEGLVTYKIEFDYSDHEDSALLAQLIPAGYHDEAGKVSTELTFKITSEGIQDYLHSNKPWTLVKYNDPVGTKYSVVTDNGQTLSREITLKSTTDDWPIGFWYIKTSKIEQILPESDQVAKKIIYRANHKFGLVYMETELRNGLTAKMDIVPFFMF